MTNSHEEEILKENVELRIKILENSIESCDSSRTMRSIRSVDFATNLASLIQKGIDIQKAIYINKESDQKVKELIGKFVENCSCRMK